MPESDLPANFEIMQIRPVSYMSTMKDQTFLPPIVWVVLYQSYYPDFPLQYVQIRLANLESMQKPGVMYEYNAKSSLIMTMIWIFKSTWGLPICHYFQEIKTLLLIAIFLLKESHENYKNTRFYMIVCLMIHILFVNLFGRIFQATFELEEEELEEGEGKLSQEVSTETRKNSRSRNYSLWAKFRVC